MWEEFISKHLFIHILKLYSVNYMIEKNALVAADLLNDRVLLFYEEEGVKLLRILIDIGTEYKGTIEHQEYELYLTIEDIEHTYTKAKSPQTNAICERFHKTVQEEFYAVAFRKKYIIPILICSKPLICNYKKLKI